MSSSHQRKALTSERLPCPECGRLQMVHVVETARLADGSAVKRLTHYKCRACGSRFFDDDAMHVIQAARARRRPSARAC
jgi:DNA-directed RNA polymerase subunit M/transcription elongation factor TFIIS